MHHASNRIVAVKIVPLEDDTGEVAREIEHLKECECPNIVQYYGNFLHEERLWIMMEFCEGSSLLDIMAATGRCLTQQQVGAALELHGDVAPGLVDAHVEGDERVVGRPEVDADDDRQQHDDADEDEDFHAA